MKNSGSRQIAQRYVKALFDIAGEQKIVAVIESDLRSFAEMMAHSEELHDLAMSPVISREEQKEAIEKLLKTLGAHPLTTRFIALLALKKRLALVAEAAELFSDMAAHERGEMKAEMVTAGKPAESEAALVAAKLGKLYGKKIALSTRQDASLLGGVVINIGSQQLDGSLAG
jgi:F-type H+-transporting ATPase subunit delta